MPRRTEVRKMFDSIAERYDLLNRIISAGLDIKWRKYALQKIKHKKPETMLDLATGTGDFAILASKILTSLKKIYALDISPKMLQIAKKKFEKGLQLPYHLIEAPAEELPLKNSSIDIITLGFGIRNFEDPNKALNEMYRVLKPQGSVIIIEPATPEIPIWKQFFSFYFHKVVPIYGSIFAKQKKAYTYLPNSVDKFPQKEKFLELCKQNGFENCYYELLTLQTCIIYFLEK